MRAIDLKELLARVGREASVKTVAVDIDGEEREVTGVVVRSKPIEDTQVSVPDRVVLKIRESG